jgi:hypothetical protein
MGIIKFSLSLASLICKGFQGVCVQTHSGNPAGPAKTGDAGPTSRLNARKAQFSTTPDGKSAAFQQMPIIGHFQASCKLRHTFGELERFRCQE